MKALRIKRSPGEWWKSLPEFSRWCFGYWAAGHATILLILIMLLAMTGCVSQTVRDQITTEVAIHDRVLKLWPGLTLAQRLKAYQKSAAAWRVQDRNVNGEKHDEPQPKKVGP